MNNIRDKFEAWFTGEVDSKTRRAMMEKDDAGYYKFQSAYNAWNVWQAASEQSQKEIAEKDARIAELERNVEKLTNANETWLEWRDEQVKQLDVLQAREKVLVEALRYVNKELIMYGYQYESKDSINVVLNEALANVRGDVK